MYITNYGLLRNEELKTEIIKKRMYNNSNNNKKYFFDEK